MSGAMQRETEAAEDADLEQQAKVTTIDDRLIVVSYPCVMSDEARCSLERALADRLIDAGLQVMVLDSGAEVYRPSMLGQVSAQLSGLEQKVAALAEMVERLVEFVEAGEDDEPEGRTLDGDPAGRARDPGAPL